MGGDQLVAEITDDRVEQRLGDSLRQAEADEFAPLRGKCAPLAGAKELIVEIKRRGTTVVLASSSGEEDLEYFLELLGVKEMDDGWTTKSDVKRSKPHPDLVHAAMEKAAATDAVMIGDSRWDIEAAANAACHARRDHRRLVRTRTAGVRRGRCLQISQRAADRARQNAARPNSVQCRSHSQVEGALVEDVLDLLGGAWSAHDHDQNLVAANEGAASATCVERHLSDIPTPRLSNRSRGCDRSPKSSRLSAASRLECRRPVAGIRTRPARARYRRLHMLRRAGSPRDRARAPRSGLQHAPFGRGSRDQHPVDT